MRLELTKEQFRELLKAVIIGVQIREAVAEGRDAPGWQKIRDIERYLLSLAGDFDSADMAEYFLNGWIASDEASEELDEELEEYDNQEFWDRLYTTLGQRDFYRTITEEERKFIADNNGLFPERMHVLYKKYARELERHGIDRLEIVVEEKMSEDLVLQLTKTEYAALKSVMVLDEGAEAIVKNAKPATGQFVLTGSWQDFDDLAGFVAATANHTRSQKKEDILDEIYDKIEELLEDGG